MHGEQCWGIPSVMILTRADVNAVYCVGRNYADHARELNNPVPRSPLIFTKSRSCIVPFSGDLILPASLGRCDHELEIAVRIGRAVQGASPEEALDAVSHIGLALDLTRRDAQSALKGKGHPWDLAKSFPGACPLTPLTPVTDPADLRDRGLRLTINGEVRQAGRTGQMIFSIAALLSFLSHHIPLVESDLVLTGTPAGVGPLKDGDVLVGWLDDQALGQAVVRR